MDDTRPITSHLVILFGKDYEIVKRKSGKLLFKIASIYISIGYVLYSLYSLTRQDCSNQKSVWQIQSAREAFCLKEATSISVSTSSRTLEDLAIRSVSGNSGCNEESGCSRTPVGNSRCFRRPSEREI